jgi:hypothetical protein
MATELGTSTAGGFTEFLLDAGSKEAIVNACAGCCGSVYIRPRLCDTSNLSGATGEADEGNAIGLQVSALDAAGAFFCFNGLCYYVPAAPDYWDTTAVAGTDFRVVTQGEWDSLNQSSDCDTCACLRVGDFLFSSDTTIDALDVENSFTTSSYDHSSTPYRVESVGIVSITLDAPMTLDVSGCSGPRGSLIWHGTGTERVFTQDTAGDGLRHESDVTGLDFYAVFRFDRATGNYYLDIWINEVPDYNHRSPQISILDANCDGASVTTDVTNTNRFDSGSNTGTITHVTSDISVAFTGNTCPCDGALNLFRKCEYVWDCVNASGTLRPLWQRCMTGAVTHDWPDEADVQCTIRNGRKVKIFTKIEDLGACPDPLPDINTSLPSPPTVTDCADCPAGPKCLWRFFAAHSPTHVWTRTGTPTLIGCRRTKDFPTWRFFNGTTPDCIFAIDVFAEDCDEASDCSLTPPTPPALPVDGTTATSLGAPLCDEVLTECPTPPDCIGPTTATLSNLQGCDPLFSTDTVVFSLTWGTDMDLGCSASGFDVATGLSITVYCTGDGSYHADVSGGFDNPSFTGPASSLTQTAGDCSGTGDALTLSLS